MEDKATKLKEIAEKIKNCKKCELWKNRANAVPGEGNPNAKIMFIGEAPGRNEDLYGIPFCGRAGAVLDELLSEIGLKREDVFITNVVKCRPPGNRDPKPEEIAICSPYLDEQIKVINPKIIVTLGNYATGYILNKFGFKAENISKVRGKIFKVTTLLTTLKIIPTYHPATSLYRPPLREYLNEDFKIIARELKEA